MKMHRGPYPYDSQMPSTSQGIPRTAGKHQKPEYATKDFPIEI